MTLVVVTGLSVSDRVQAGSEGIEIKSTRKKGGAVDTHGVRDQWMCVFVYEIVTDAPPEARWQASVPPTIPAPAMTIEGNGAGTTPRRKSSRLRRGAA